MRHTLNHERSLRHDSGTQRQQDDQSGNTLKPCAAKLRGSDKRSPVPPNFACQKRERERERERESCAFHALWPSAIAAATNNTSNTNQTNHTNHTNERTNERTNKQTNKQTNPRRNFPVGLDLTNVIDMQSARASCGIRAHDLPLTERVLCQLS